MDDQEYRKLAIDLCNKITKFIVDENEKMYSANLDSASPIALSATIMSLSDVLILYLGLLKDKDIDSDTITYWNRIRERLTKTVADLMSERKLDIEFKSLPPENKFNPDNGN